jgi:hypothetical protein
MLFATVAAAILLACSLRLESIVATLLAAYVLAIAELVALTLVLSPIHAVTRTGLTVAELAVLAGAIAVWNRAGRPRPPVARLGTRVREVTHNVATLVLSLAVGLSAAYQLLLVLTVPANNWDSLTYHLPRAASWVQHSGIHWIADAPTERMNEFGALAEQVLLALFVTTGSGRLHALPQFVALGALSLGVFGIARRLGETVTAAAFVALLFATFPVVVTEATTAQNDLVAASLVVASVMFALGGTRRETGLAGIAVGLALATKLTTVFALPILLALAARRGRRELLSLAAWGVGAYALLGGWVLVENVSHTGQILGNGGGRVEHAASPAFPGSVSTAYRLGYHLLDLSGFTDATVGTMAGIGVVGLAAALAALGLGWASAPSPAWALAFFAPLAVIVVAAVAESAAKAAQLPVDEPSSTSAVFSWDVNERVIEDLSAFGPIGGLLLLSASALTLWRGARRQVDTPRLLLGLALPLAVVGFALTSKYNPWMNRFLLLPAALTMPLLAPLSRRRSLSAGIAVVAVVGLGLAHVESEHKPLDGATRPWELSRAEAMRQTFLPRVGDAVEEFDRVVPPDACVGVVLGVDEPVYLLYGSDLERGVVYLRSETTVGDIEAAGVTHVVTPAGHEDALRAALESAGWTLGTVGSHWALVTAPVSPGSSRPPCRGS